MNRDFSLIDANLARAREGIRTVEDICRFVLNAREEYEILRGLRHAFDALEKSFGPASLIQGREGIDSGKDNVEVEETVVRHSVLPIIRANMNRTTQAVRVLEEYAQLYAPQQTSLLGKLRYNLYQAEWMVLRKTPHYWMNLYFEQGTVYPLSSSVDELESYVDAGAQIIQLRDKESSKKDVYQKARQLLDRLKQRTTSPALLIINDYPDIAAALPAAGVHIGQDTDVGTVRRFVGTGKIIGRSNQTLEQMQASLQSGADYVSIGPIFSTNKKPDRKPVGLDVITEISQTIEEPWVAIGGITSKNMQEVQDAGAKNVAMIEGAKEFFI